MNTAGRQSGQHGESVNPNVEESNPKITTPGAIAGSGGFKLGGEKAKHERNGVNLIEGSMNLSPHTDSQVKNPLLSTDPKKGLQLLPPISTSPGAIEVSTEDNEESPATPRDEPSIALPSLSSVPQPGDSIENGVMVAAQVVDDEERTKMATEIAELQAKLKLHEEKEDAVQVVPIAEVIIGDDGNDDSRWTSSSRKWVLFGVLLVGCVVGAVVAVIAALMSPNLSPSAPTTVSFMPSISPSHHPTGQPSSSPTISRRTLLLQDLLANATTFDTVEEWSTHLIENSETPQAQAIEWLAEEDEYIWMSEALSSVEAHQRYAFVVLYFATSGPDWIFGGSYLLNTSTSVCNWNGELILEADDDAISLLGFWQGVDCDSEGLVYDLSLRRTNLVGTLPSEIALLQSLAYIYLDQNSLSGTLPSELGLLTDLSVIWLDFNFLSGSLPPLHNLSKLDSLWFDDNAFSGTLPTDMPVSLRSLRFTYNYISGGLPSEWGETLTDLQEFYGGNNWLGGDIPTEWGNMTQLQHFGIEYNGFFTGPIPSELGGMTSLTALRLHENFLTGTLPPELGILSDLTQLVASNNPQLGGSIPSEWGNLTRMSWLSLQENSHTGPIPTSIGLMSSLASIYLQGNKFSGSLPSEVGTLSSSSYLEIYENHFSGSLPSEIGLLTQLVSLTIYDNPALTGTVPAEFQSLSDLEYFGLRNTSLTGSLDFIFCDSWSGDIPWLSADCLSDSEIECSCCSYCCSGDVCEYI